MKKALWVLAALATAIFIVCAAVVITLNFRPLYEADIEAYSLTESTGLSKDEILENYQAMIDYNNLGGPDELEFPTFTMSEGGRIHFEEVRRIFYAIEYAMIACGAVAALSIVLSIRRKQHTYRLLTGIFTVALPAAVGIMAAVSWDNFFVFFHNVMFSNDYWIFDSQTDPVITILPDGYFLHCVIMIIAICACAAAGFIFWYFHSTPSVSIMNDTDPS